MPNLRQNNYLSKKAQNKKPLPIIGVVSVAGVVGGQVFSVSEKSKMKMCPNKLETNIFTKRISRCSNRSNRSKQKGEYICARVCIYYI